MTRAERSQKVRETIKDAVDSWLARHTSAEIRADIDKQLNQGKYEAVRKIAGIDIRWNRLEIVSGSPLWRQVESAIAGAIKPLDFPAPELSEKEMAFLKREFERGYKARIKEVAYELGHSLATKEAKEVVAELTKDLV